VAETLSLGAALEDGVDEGLYCDESEGAALRDCVAAAVADAVPRGDAVPVLVPAPERVEEMEPEELGEPVGVREGVLEDESEPLTRGELVVERLTNEEGDADTVEEEVLDGEEERLTDGVIVSASSEEEGETLTEGLPLGEGERSEEALTEGDVEVLKDFPGDRDALPEKVPFMDSVAPAEGDGAALTDTAEEAEAPGESDSIALREDEKLSKRDAVPRGERETEGQPDDEALGNPLPLTVRLFAPAGEREGIWEGESESDAEALEEREAQWELDPDTEALRGAVCEGRTEDDVDAEGVVDFDTEADSECFIEKVAAVDADGLREEDGEPELETETVAERDAVAQRVARGPLTLALPDNEAAPEVLQLADVHGFEVALSLSDREEDVEPEEETDTPAVEEPFEEEVGVCENEDDAEKEPEALSLSTVETEGGAAVGDTDTDEDIEGEAEIDADARGEWVPLFVAAPVRLSAPAGLKVGAAPVKVPLMVPEGQDVLDKLQRGEREALGQGDKLGDTVPDAVVVRDAVVERLPLELALPEPH
jgi:hypothetical protein